MRFKLGKEELLKKFLDSIQTNDINKELINKIKTKLLEKLEV